MRTGAPICGAAIARPLPNRDCQSRSVSRMSSRMTRTAVDRGLVIGSHRARRIGSPKSRMRCMVMRTSLSTKAAGRGGHQSLNMGIRGHRGQLRGFLVDQSDSCSPPYHLPVVKFTMEAWSTEDESNNQVVTCSVRLRVLQAPVM